MKLIRDDIYEDIDIRDLGIEQQAVEPELPRGIYCDISDDEVDEDAIGSHTPVPGFIQAKSDRGLPLHTRHRNYPLGYLMTERYKLKDCLIVKYPAYRLYMYESSDNTSKMAIYRTKVQPGGEGIIVKEDGKPFNEGLNPIWNLKGLEFRRAKNWKEVEVLLPHGKPDYCLEKAFNGALGCSEHGTYSIALHNYR